MEYHKFREFTNNIVLTFMRSI